MSLSNLDFIFHISDEASYCLDVTDNLTYEQLLSDETLKRAVVRSLEIIGEATKNFTPEFKLKYPQVPWKKMAGMRDRLIHQYFGVDYETVWKTLKEDIPEIKKHIDNIIQKENLS